MSKTSNEIKNIQLGMSYGKARAKLNKLIMFDFAKRLNLDICFHCNQKIISVDDLSVEHKIPWLHSGKTIELFFDLNNIAFSHLSCNCSASRGFVIKDESHRKEHSDKVRQGLLLKGLARVVPAGKVWCYCCKENKDEKEFYTNKSNYTGFQKACKSCVKKTRASKA